MACAKQPGANMLAADANGVTKSCDDKHGEAEQRQVRPKEFEEGPRHQVAHKTSSLAAARQGARLRIVCQ